MARLAVIRLPGAELGFDYNTGNLRVGAVYCVNNSGRTVRGTATLTDGRRIVQDFGAGDRLVNFPQGAVRVTVDPVTKRWTAIGIRSLGGRLV